MSIFLTCVLMFGVLITQQVSAVTLRCSSLLDHMQGSFDTQVYQQIKNMRPDIFSKVKKYDSQILYRGVRIEPESYSWGYREAHYYAEKGDLYTSESFDDALSYATRSDLIREGLKQSILVEYQFPKDYFTHGYFTPDGYKNFVFEMTSPYDEIPFIRRIGVIEVESLKKREMKINWYTLQEFLQKYQPQNLELLTGHYQAQPPSPVEARAAMIEKPQSWSIRKNAIDVMLDLEAEGQRNNVSVLKKKIQSILKWDTLTDGKYAGQARKYTLKKSGLTVYFREELRELAAYEISEVLGLNLVPPTVYRDDGERVGCLQLGINGGDGKVLEEYTPLEFFFQFVVAQNDNHSGNNILSERGRYFYFDFALALWEKDVSNKKLEEKFQYYFEDIEFEKLKLSRKDFNRLNKIPDDTIRDNLDGILSSELIEAVIARKKFYLEKMKPFL